MHKISEVAITLERDCQHTPWGIRLVGGSDLDTPLIITKVGIAVKERPCLQKDHDRHQLLEGKPFSYCVTNGFASAEKISVKPRRKRRCTWSSLWGAVCSWHMSNRSLSFNHHNFVQSEHIIVLLPMSVGLVLGEKIALKKDTSLTMNNTIKQHQLKWVFFIPYTQFNNRTGTGRQSEPGRIVSWRCDNKDRGLRQPWLAAWWCELSLQKCW